MITATEVKVRPILFRGPMVRAILAGEKTQTRRVVKGNFAPDQFIREKSGSGYGWYWPNWKGKENIWTMTGAVGIARDAGFDVQVKCPYGVPGDRLYVRETTSPIPEAKPAGYFTDPKWINRKYWYAADNDKPMWGGKWTPSILMPRDASRITVEITDIRVQRLQKISEDDAIAEGAKFAGFPASLSNVSAFGKLWEKINGKRGFGWDANPWVWCISFQRAEITQ